MDQHINNLGWLHIIYNSIFLVVIVPIVLIAAVPSVIILIDNPEKLPAFLVPLSVLFVFLSIFSFPGIIGGYFLLKRKNWARIFVIVLGCLNLTSVPFGTLLGIYTLKILTSIEASKLFIEEKDSSEIMNVADRWKNQYRGF
jgi:hypothetical protein